MTYYTDYPFVELGDTPGKIAPIRRCVLISYDGDKYLEVRIGGKVLKVKAGYVYTRRGRLGEVPSVWGDPILGKLPWPIVREGS